MKSDTDGNAKREAGARRRFGKEFKRQVVEETLAGGTSVAGIALRHRLNANLVFTWRRRYLRAIAQRPAKLVEMLPVTVADTGAAVPMGASKLISAEAGKSPRRSRGRGAIEIELNGAHIQLKGAVDTQALRVVLTVLASR